MKAHCYADDRQVHVSTGAADIETAVQRFVSCTERIQSWMSSNRLKINADKTPTNADKMPTKQNKADKCRQNKTNADKNADKTVTVIKPTSYKRLCQRLGSICCR